MVGLLAPHQLLDARQDGRDARHAVVVGEARGGEPLLAVEVFAIAREAAGHHQGGAREASLVFEGRGDHRARVGAARMQENEEVAGGLLRSGSETVNLLHAAILALSRSFCKLPAEKNAILEVTPCKRKDSSRPCGR